MWDCIAQCAQLYQTIINTTHILEEAEQLSDTVAIMVEGKIKAQGSVQQLKSEYGKGLEVEILF